MYIVGLVLLMVHIAVELLPHVTVLVLIICLSRITLIVAIIVMTFIDGSFTGFVRGVGRVWVVHMVEVIDFPVVAMVDMANIMMINQKPSLRISVDVLVVVDVFPLMMPDKTLCCLCCVLVKQV